MRTVAVGVGVGVGVVVVVAVGVAVVVAVVVAVGVGVEMNAAIARGPKPKPSDEKMSPETIRLMRKTRSQLREIAKSEGVQVGKWMRSAIEDAVERNGRG